MANQGARIAALEGNPLLARGDDIVALVDALAPAQLQRLLALANAPPAPVQPAAVDPVMQRAHAVIGMMAAAVAAGDAHAAGVAMGAAGMAAPANVLNPDDHNARSYAETAIGVRRISTRFYAAVSGRVAECSAEEVAAAMNIIDNAGDEEMAALIALRERDNAELPAGAGDLRQSGFLRRLLLAVARGELAFWNRVSEARRAANEQHIERLAAFIKRSEMLSQRLRDLTSRPAAASTAAVKRERDPNAVLCPYCQKPDHTFEQCFRRKRDEKAKLRGRAAGAAGAPAAADAPAAAAAAAAPVKNS